MTAYAMACQVCVSDADLPEADRLRVAKVLDLLAALPEGAPLEVKRAIVVASLEGASISVKVMCLWWERRWKLPAHANAPVGAWCSSVRRPARRVLVALNPARTACRQHLTCRGSRDRR